MIFKLTGNLQRLEYMSVQYVEFKGTTSLLDSAKPIEPSIKTATKELNDWWDSKIEYTLISIENVMITKSSRQIK
jgi:hypothetical protein